MNKEMRKFYRKLKKMDNRGVTFKKYDGKLISDFEAEDLNLPEGYSITNNEIYNGDVKIGELEVASFEENEDIDLSEFEDLDVDYEEDEEETRRFSFRNGLNSVRYGISNFFGNLGKRKNIEIDEDIIEEDEEVVEEEQPTKNDIKNSLNVTEILTEIFKLNPSASIKYDAFNGKMILLDAKPEELKLPEGFYYNEKNGITNKHNTESGGYVAIDVEVLNDENTNEDDDILDDIEIEYSEPKRVKVFRKLKGAVLLAGTAIRNFFYGIANNTSKFFENFGKRKEIIIDEDILGDDEDITISKNTSNTKNSGKNNRQSNNIEELKRKMSELTTRYDELNDLTSSKIDSLDEETKAKYAYTADTANSILYGLTKEQILEMYKNGGKDALNNYFNSNFTLEERVNRVEAAIKYLEDVNKSLDEDIEKTKNKSNNNTNNSRAKAYNDKAIENRLHIIEQFKTMSKFVNSRLEKAQTEKGDILTKQEKAECVRESIDLLKSKTAGISQKEIAKRNQVLDKYAENRVRIDYVLGKIAKEEKSLSLINRYNNLGRKIEAYNKQLPNLQTKLDETLIEYNTLLKYAPKRSKNESEFNKYDNDARVKTDFDKVSDDYNRISNKLQEASKTYESLSDTVSTLSKTEIENTINKYYDLIITLGYRGKDFTEMKDAAEARNEARMLVR